MYPEAKRGRARADSEEAGRDGSIDVLKVWGLTGIIALHLGSGLGDWSAVFFVVSGYLATGRRPLGQQTLRRLHSLVVPYCGWLVVIGGLLVLRLGLEGGLASQGPE